MKRIALLGLLLSIVVLGIYSRPAAAADLTRAEATKLLGHMGLENIVIAGIVNGILSNGVDAPRAGSSHVATVFLYSEMNGKPANRTQIFFHDNENGSPMDYIWLQRAKTSFSKIIIRIRDMSFARLI